MASCSSDRGHTHQSVNRTNRRLAYGYRHIERFLAELALVGAGEVLNQALTGWTACLWKRHPEPEDGPGTVYYIDGHRKTVYSDSPVAGGTPGKGAGVPHARRLARSGEPSAPLDKSLISCYLNLYN